MYNYLLPFLSVVLGYLSVIILNPSGTRRIKLLLAFSGAFLLGMTIFTLIPEVFHFHGEHQHDKSLGACIVGGILLQIVLEFFSNGAEHGHMHKHCKPHKSFPWALFLSLSLHSVLEGFPLHTHQHLAYGIFIHHLPIAMVLTIFLIKAQLGKWQTAVFLLLFALMTPFGAWLSQSLPFLGQYSREASAVVIGIFLHISSVILYETSENHKFNIYKLSVIIIGFCLAYFV